ncbi:TIGR01777 family protein [Actinopolyspora erythraea]|uniref:Multidrug MFS transporter n=1 Tax=Actinopolyspora erythraea TaxID=414996 RepID=A0A099D548_9ACTN|nr:TIGR01777 family oxidoreductase [Actinopolyspora erythraea]ASU79582.1 TIGR01777 family protein [Actinopolyspora erythraea]KGI81026.1 multidrug MFS transporter [Actinopolyspora erythraea]
MRVVIAGSSGLLGSHLVPALRHARHEVIRLVRRDSQAPDERGWDPEAGVIEEGALDGADAVINLCGAPLGGRRWSAERKRELLRSRTRPTALLAEAIGERGVPTLINASGVDFYGDTGGRVITEAAGPGSGFLADLCQRWEAAAEAAAPARVVRLRTGPVLAPSGGLLGQLRPLFSFMLGGRLGDGTQYMPWISLDDEISAIRFVLENQRISGPVNMTGPEPVSNAEFTRALGEALGRPAPWVIPGFAMRAVLGEFAQEVALTGQRAVPAVLEEHGFTFQHPTVRSALGAAVSA